MEENRTDDPAEQEREAHNVENTGVVPAVAEQSSYQEQHEAEQARRQAVTDETEEHNRRLREADERGPIAVPVEPQRTTSSQFGQTGQSKKQEPAQDPAKTEPPTDSGGNAS
jgi:hypothetical protein